MILLILFVKSVILNIMIDRQVNPVFFLKSSCISIFSDYNLLIINEGWKSIMNIVSHNELKIGYEKKNIIGEFYNIKKFIRNTTIAYKPNKVRAVIKQYLWESGCNEVVETYLKSLLDLDDSKLKYYRIIWDGSHRYNYILLRPDSQDVYVWDEKPDSPYIYLNLSEETWAEVHEDSNLYD